MRGRPTKYNEDILIKARHYVDSGYEENGDLIPMVCGLALHIGVSRETVYKWAAEEDKEVFSDIVSDLQTKQELKLFVGGLGGAFNASITKLALSKHGYTDKVDHGFDAEKPVTFIMKMGKDLTDKGDDDDE